jgi:hypothetical protein
MIPANANPAAMNANPMATSPPVAVMTPHTTIRASALSANRSRDRTEARHRLILCCMPGIVSV